MDGGSALGRAGIDLRLLHLSTDAVFDGTKEGVYTEEDVPNPQGVYSRTKLDGEHAVFEANPQAVIARVNFYGWSLGGQRSLGEFFFNNLSDGKHVNGFTDVIFCPMWVNHLAQTLITMLEKDLHGLYHVVGGQAMSKYQFGVEVARKFGLRDSLISPQSVEMSSLTAKRSHNLHLSVHELSTALGHELPEFSTGLDGFYTQYQSLRLRARSCLWAGHHIPPGWDDHWRVWHRLVWCTARPAAQYPPFSRFHRPQ